jgi:hypothetical protein
MHHSALHRARPHDRDFDHQVVEALRPQRQHRHLRARFHLEHAHAVAVAQHVVGRLVLGWNVLQLECLAGFSEIMSSARRTIDSMPSARTSIFRMPSASMSSLSHWMIERSSIAAFSTGTSRVSLPRLITKPPECCDRCRG